MPPSVRPQRVAIIGGGCAALTAAFELTRPELAGRYEVTVYQMGWRLGGKGASGRGPAGRIEEHGLHLWMGFYENAFALMRACYAERHAAFPACRFASWRDAFQPAPDVAVADRLGDDWVFWRAHFAPGRGEPGDPPADGSPFTVLAYLRQAALLVTELLRSAGADVAARPLAASTAATSVAGAIDALLRYGRLASLAAIFEAADLLRQAVGPDGPPLLRDGSGLLLRLLDALAAAARQQLERLAAQDRPLQRVWQVIDLVLAILRGATLQGLAFDPRGFDAINDHDWRDWLRHHGASPASLDSGFMRGIYDLAFAFEDGDPQRPRLAAGVALRGALRMFFTYRGALFYTMGAGMGDVVFAPLYQVLARRGVRFEFFHRLRQVHLAPAAPGDATGVPHVQALSFDVQARTVGGAPYRPLVDVHGVPSWPAQPDWAQLDGGAALAGHAAFEAAGDPTRAGELRLQVQRDFDFVVLGVPVAVLPAVAAELIAAEPRWREMVERVKTVATQAVQVWLREDTAQLGWPHGPVNLSGFVEPFDTWADMGHLIPEEGFQGRVRAIAYFCSVLPDRLDGTEAPAGSDAFPAFQAARRDAVRRHAVDFLQHDVAALWPNARRPDAEGGGFRWELLVDPAECGAAPDSPQAPPAAADARRFDTQYWTANVAPTDRYVLSLPGSPMYRLSPLDRSFDNLTIAGDWTATGLDTGCIESAVISGRLAAHAIAGLPALQDIVGYDHP